MFTRECLLWMCICVSVVPSLCFYNNSLFNQFDSADSEKIVNGLERIQMIFYEGVPEKQITYNYTLDRSENLMKFMNLKKPFVLYIHGYQEHPVNESIRTIVSAYLERGLDNIVILDWSSVAFDSYIKVVLNTKEIAKYTAMAIKTLVSVGLDAGTLHVIGHSLGAQVAGFIGRYLDFTIPRITGLDPANPLFYQFGADHIDEKSGRMVDVIHTDGGIYGAYDRTGSVDFFANGGVRPQPGCPLFGTPLSPRGLCSHWRSWRFYAESVVNNMAFPALQCESYGTFLQGGCKGNRIVYFGYSMQGNISGSYYFLTKKFSPYGRGLRGIKNKT